MKLKLCIQLEIVPFDNRVRINGYEFVLICHINNKIFLNNEYVFKQLLLYYGLIWTSYLNLEIYNKKRRASIIHGNLTQMYNLLENPLGILKTNIAKTFFPIFYRRLGQIVCAKCFTGFQDIHSRQYTKSTMAHRKEIE
jgi:hypothetical protein